MQFLKKDVDMLHSPLIGSVAMFALPLILTGVLQLLFNAADMVVVGRFTGPEALAAVGSTGSLIALFTNLFMGLSAGTSVIVSRAFGAGDNLGVRKGVHTSITVALVSGLLVMALGLLGGRGMLHLMGSPEDVIDQAALSLRIYFVGMPIMMVFNFAAAVLRAVGDTQRPLYYLTTAGVSNLLMNLLFVIVFHMGVAGVALATVLSQALALGLTLNCLLRTDRVIRLDVRALSIDKATFKELLRVGLPAGLQSTLFSISNVLIQSSVNSFGSTVMAANSAAANIESFAYCVNNAMYQAAVTFTSANVGAKQEWRIRRIARTCLAMNLAVGGVVCVLAMLFNHPLLSLYTSDPTVIEYGKLRMAIICMFIPVCGWMDDMVGVLRGMGYSIMPMIVTLIGACGLRVVWIMTVFLKFHSLKILYASYPISWTLTVSVHLVCFWMALRKPRWKEARAGIPPAAE